MAISNLLANNNLDLRVGSLSIYDSGVTNPRKLFTETSGKTTIAAGPSVFVYSFNTQPNCCYNIEFISSFFVTAGPNANLGSFQRNLYLLQAIVGNVAQFPPASPNGSVRAGDLVLLNVLSLSTTGNTVNFVISPTDPADTTKHVWSIEITETQLI